MRFTDERLEIKNLTEIFKYFLMITTDVLSIRLVLVHFQLGISIMVSMADLRGTPL